MKPAFLEYLLQPRRACVWRHAIPYALYLLLCATLANSTEKSSTGTPAAKAWSVSWEPAKPHNGDPVVFRVKPPTVFESLSGSWLTHTVFFNFDRRTHAWYGIAGAPLETKPGTYTLDLTGRTSGGRTLSRASKVKIGVAKYPAIQVTVAAKYTEPNPEQQQIINQDKALKQRIFAGITPDRQWSGKFEPPVTAKVSDVFGTQRVFNGETQSTHQGLDYSAPEGTPVEAVNAGTVLLARPMYFEGNCVVIDHGQGLLSLYLHLSEFKVKEGDQVVRGQEIGLSGATGRATGPHLHLAMRWQGVYVNPAVMLSLKFF